MANKVIVLDAGHGRATAGKRTMNGSRGVIPEWVMNDSVCNKIASVLKDYNCKVYRTDDTTGNTDVSLDERVRRCNKYDADLFVSIHHNAGGGSGTEVYYHTKGTAEDKKFAKIVAPKLASSCGMRNRGVKYERWAVLTCKSTAILVEGGFMDTTSDYEIITSERGQQLYANAVAESVIEYLGLKKIQTTQPSTNSKFNVGDRVKVKSTATHYAPTDGSPQGKPIASFVNGSVYTVKQVNGNKLLLDEITSWVWDFDVDKLDNSFKVQITCDTLNVRSKADFNSSVVTTVKKGDVFTIVEESNGLGLLKSYLDKRNGWISMNEKYVKKI